jgi:hypothetical protein
MYFSQQLDALGFAKQASPAVFLLAYLLKRASPRKIQQKLCEKQDSNVHELGLVLSLTHCNARELTVASCACRGLEKAASNDSLWKALWRSRYDRILWSVPEVLRSIDHETDDLHDPMAEMCMCLQELRTPPCWWVGEQPQSYLEQVMCFQDQLGPRKRWKVFYFAFGAHWPKWAVAEHNTAQDCWLVIHGTVFNMTEFDSHPGRREPFLKYAGLDATDAFEAMRHSWSAKMGEFGDEFIVRDLQLPRDGSIIRPFWLLQQEAVPTWKDMLFRLLLFDTHRKLSYHDFW